MRVFRTTRKCLKSLCRGTRRLRLVFCVLIISVWLLIYLQLCFRADKQVIKTLKSERSRWQNNMRQGTPKAKLTLAETINENRQSVESYNERGISCSHFLTKVQNATYGKCQPQVSTPESCKLAEQFYYLDSKLRKCKTPGDGKICVAKSRRSKAGNILNIKCNKKICLTGSRHSPIKVIVVDPRIGLLQVESEFLSVLALEKGLRDILEETIRDKLYFIVIKCRMKKSNRTMSQLLYIDPNLTVRRNNNRQRKDNLINVNILLVDSVSRAHFYRSLPQTIDTFRNLTIDPKNSPAKVFDFELFQAIHGHTTENTHALFTGKLLTATQRGQPDLASVQAGKLSGTFSRAGYQTMWQEDLCWEGSWGLVLDLVAMSYVDLVEKLKRNYIDHTGITHSSCEILSSYGIQTPFERTLDDQICYNGEFQHSYLLRYTIDTLQAIHVDNHALPLLAYTALNVGHDQNARRIQSLDPALVNYVTTLAQSEDTLTIILADHGNSYSEFVIATVEGRFEMFHPSLFIIVPNKVAKLLGSKAMTALRTNQHRLLTMIDLHHSLMALATPLDGRVSPTGVFTPISVNRTCDDLQLSTPNLCVCNGWDNPSANDSRKLAIVEFAIGELNSLIENQLYVSGKHRTVETSCRRLRPIRFGNIRERFGAAKGELITTMDIFVQAGNVVEQDEDLFHVEVASIELPDRFSLEMKMSNYERLTMYAHYGVCADKNVDLKLCICSKKQQISSTKSKFYLGKESEISTQVNDTDGCVSLLHRNHSDASFAYEITNTCTEKEFEVFVDAEHQNIKFSEPLPFIVTLPAQSMWFLFSGRRGFSSRKTTLRVMLMVLNSRPKQVSLKEN